MAFGLGDALDGHDVHRSHPIAYKKGGRALRAMSQFGEASTKVLAV